MKIVELRAENFKRLSAVRIRPDGALVQVTGRNAQGKSSVMDAIWAALGGKAAIPIKPVKDGAEKGHIFLDLGEIKVTRRFTGEDRSTLIVEAANGSRYSSPQSVLDALVGQLSFDPLAFSRMDEKKQAAMLRQLAGYDTSKLDADRARLFDERTTVNRDTKRLQAQIGPEVDGPDEETSVSELAKKHAAASATRRTNENERATLKRIADAGGAANARVKAAKEELAAAEADVTALKETYTKQKTLVGALIDPDLDAIAEEMETAETRNAAARAKVARAARAAEYKTKADAAAALTARIDAIDEGKAAALASAKFPVEGMAVDGDVVTMGGIPLKQASSAEQIRIGLAIGAALNPDLRVVIVRDGSLLDADGLRMVAEWAEAKSMQVWIERVADGTTTGIVIEDGEGANFEAEVEVEPAKTPTINDGDEMPFC